MTPPVPYQTYSRDEAIRCFGSTASATTHCDGAWVHLGKFILGFSGTGVREPDVHFCDSTRFHWYAARPFREAEGDYPAIPRCLQELSESRDAVHLFVQIPSQDDRFVYVGRLSHLGMMGSAQPGHFGEAQFDLERPLPAAVWERVGGLIQHAGGHAAMDGALQEIATASTWRSRLTAYRKLVEFWRGEPVSADGFSDDEIDAAPVSAPASLRWLYRWAGRCPDVMSMGYFSFVPPDKLEANGGNVDVVVECQNCQNYAVRAADLSKSDPDVYEQAEGPEQRVGTLSEFLVWFFINQTIGQPPYQRTYLLTPSKFDRFQKTIPAAPVATYPCQFREADIEYFGGQGVLASAHREDRKMRLEVAAKSETDLDSLESLLGIRPDPD